MNIQILSVRNLQKIFATIAVLAMVFLPFANVQLAGAHGGGGEHTFSSSVTPTTIVAGATENFTFTVTNTSGGSTPAPWEIKSFTIKVPTNFTVNVGSLSVSGDWQVGFDVPTNEIRVSALGGATQINGGDSKSVTGTITSTGGAATTQWTARAFKNNSFTPGTGAEFHGSNNGIIDIVVLPQCPEGYTGTHPDCVPPACPEGYTGTYPDCVAPVTPCPEGYTGTYPDCVPPACPEDTEGTYPDCVDIVIPCDDPYTGNFPDCVPPACPEGYTGTYPDCVAPVTPCPEGYTGTYPDCVPPACPEGYTGTYPDCVPPVVDQCLNIDGVQESIPNGMYQDNEGDCVTPEDDKEVITICKFNNDTEEGIAGWNMTLSNDTEEGTYELVTGDNGCVSQEVDPEIGPWHVTEEDRDGWNFVDASATYGEVIDVQGNPTCEFFPQTEQEVFLLVVIDQTPSYNCSFYNEQEDGGGDDGGDDNGGGGNGIRVELTSRDDDDEDEDDAPTPQVLGESTSVMPVGAPNTGAGGTSVPSLGLHGLLAILAMRKGVQATNVK